MKKAFTMIELVFVIVILGILAAVALPKFVGMGVEAHRGNVQTFVGTLNATLGPTWWSKEMAINGDGNVSKLGIDNTTKLEEYTEKPTELMNFDLTKCDSNTSKVIADIDLDKDGTADGNITCITGTTTTAPKFKVNFSK